MKQHKSLCHGFFADFILQMSTLGVATRFCPGLTSKLFYADLECRLRSVNRYIVTNSVKYFLFLCLRLQSFQRFWSPFFTNCSLVIAYLTFQSRFSNLLKISDQTFSSFLLLDKKHSLKSKWGQRNVCLALPHNNSYGEVHHHYRDTFSWISFSCKTS